TVADVDLVGTVRRQAFLIAFPGHAGLGELIGDGLADRVAGGRNRRRAVDVVFAGRSLNLVGRIDGRDCRIGALAGDRADHRAGWGVGIRRLRSEIGHAIEIVPIGIIVALYTEIRAADDFEVVAEARVCNRVIVGGEIRRQRVAVRERRVRVV